jgi:hypothetical protein
MSDTPVYSVQRFEFDTLDQNRVLFTVHYFATRDDFTNGKAHSLKFFVPVSSVAPLANLLNLVLRELKEEGNGKAHLGVEVESIRVRTIRETDR